MPANATHSLWGRIRIYWPDDEKRRIRMASLGQNGVTTVILNSCFKANPTSSLLAPAHLDYQLGPAQLAHGSLQNDALFG